MRIMRHCNIDRGRRVGMHALERLGSSVEDGDVAKGRGLGPLYRHRHLLRRLLVLFFLGGCLAAKGEEGIRKDRRHVHKRLEGRWLALLNGLLGLLFDDGPVSSSSLRVHACNLFRSFIVSLLLNLVPDLVLDAI